MVIHRHTWACMGIHCILEGCHHHHSSLSWATTAVSFGSDQIPPHSSDLSLLLPGTPVYVQLLQVSLYSVFKSEPWPTLIAFAFA